MLHQDKIPQFSLKQILFPIAGIFAVAAVLLIIFFTSAATAIGSDPFNAITLSARVNTGVLGPGEQRWFRSIPNLQNQTTSIEKSLTFNYSSLNDSSLNQLVSLQIFNETQIQFFDAQAIEQMASLGTGQAIVNQATQTSTLFWSSVVESDQTYYILILNQSDFAIDYQLIVDDVAGQGSTAEVDQPGEALPVATTLGVNPGSAARLEASINQGRLQPKTTYWYTFVQSQPGNNKPIQDRKLTLFFTPDDGNRRHNVNFELYTANQVEAWLHGDAQALVNFGAGSLISRDGDAQTGERLWSGTVVNGDTYYVAVENGSDVEIDYWLFTDDISNAQLGSQPAPQKPPVFAQGAAPQTAIPVKSGQNIGGLDPGEEAWYSFSFQDDDNEFFEEMDLTMIVTPDDGNRIHYVTFDVFTADGVKGWSPGDNSQINNLGAGSLVVRDNNSLTGERFWTGWIVENELYYVQIRNGSDTRIDYWLFTEDVYGPELGK